MDNFNVKDIKDLLYDSFDKMNKDFYYIEPMLIPIVLILFQKFFNQIFKIMINNL